MTLITEFLLTFCLLIYIVALIKRSGRDDTDSTERSGLILYTDYGTGVQYVSTVMGGLTARIDGDGKPVIHPDYQ